MTLWNIPVKYTMPHPYNRVIDPLLRRHDSDNVFKNRSVRLSLRRLYFKRRRMSGYRFGMLICIGSTGTATLINFILTIWAWKSFGVDAGFGAIQQGNCGPTKRLSLWLHLAINILGTALLSASNYAMQLTSIDELLTFMD